MPISVMYSEADPERRILVQVIYSGIALWMQNREEEKAGKADATHVLSAWTGGSTLE